MDIEYPQAPPIRQPASKSRTFAYGKTNRTPRIGAKLSGGARPARWPRR